MERIEASAILITVLDLERSLITVRIAKKNPLLGSKKNL